MSIYIVTLEIEEGDRKRPSSLGTVTIATAASDAKIALERAVSRVERLLRDADEQQTWVVTEQSTVELQDIGQRPVVLVECWRPLDDGPSGFLKVLLHSPDKGKGIKVHTDLDATVEPELLLNVIEDD